jgi:hypothetical protein
MVINPGEKYLYRARRFKAAETPSPLDDDCNIGFIKDLFKTEPVECAGFDTIEINVIDPHSTGIFVDKSKSRTGDVFRTGHSPAGCKPPGKEGFTGSKFAIKKDVRRELE